MALPRRRTPFVIGSAVFGLLAVSCGNSTSHNAMPGMDHTSAAAAGGSVTRTVEVTMADINFDVPRIDVKAGQTIRFVFRNRGKLVHEAVIGDSAAQDAHEKEMAGTAGMDMHEPGTVTVHPGTTGELTHTFTNPGQSLIGCHQPGHYAAGMKMTVNVS